MLPILLCVCLAIAAGVGLLMVTAERPGAKRARQRLAALQQDRRGAAEGESTSDIRKPLEMATAIPWLNRWLTRMNLTAAAELFLYQAGMATSLGTLLAIAGSGAAVAMCLLYLRLGDLVPAFILASGFLPLPFLYVQRRRNRRLGLLEQQLPEALDMMVAALRVGHSFTACLGAVALESADPIGKELRKCFDEQNFGVDLRDALVNLVARAPVQDLRIFVAAVLIQKESGGNLAEVLEKLAHTTRERFRLRRQVSVHTAQGRMTGWVLSLLPILLGFGMYIVNPAGMSILWTNPTGLKLLCGAAVMDVLGACIIRKIVQVRV